MKYFPSDGKLLTCSADGTALLSDGGTGKRIGRYTFDDIGGGSRGGSGAGNSNSNRVALNKLCLYDESSCFFVGDDDGGMFFVDSRVSNGSTGSDAGIIALPKEQDDFISAMLLHPTD